MFVYLFIFFSSTENIGKKEKEKKIKKKKTNKQNRYVQPTSDNFCIQKAQLSGIWKGVVNIPEAENRRFFISVADL